MPDNLRDMGGVTSGRATIEEMRAFWTELLQFCKQQAVLTCQG